MLAKVRRACCRARPLARPRLPTLTSRACSSSSDSGALPRPMLPASHVSYAPAQPINTPTLVNARRVIDRSMGGCATCSRAGAAVVHSLRHCRSHASSTTQPASPPLSITSIHTRAHTHSHTYSMAAQSASALPPAAAATPAPHMVSFTQLDIETERYRSELHDFLGSMQDFEPAVRSCRRRLHSTPLHG